MSVLVKGTDIETMMMILTGEPYNFSPNDIVELPPHGDLIDRDALVPDICNDWNGFSVPDDDYSARCIKNAPTVIGAEGNNT